VGESSVKPSGTLPKMRQRNQNTTLSVTTITMPSSEEAVLFHDPTSEPSRAVHWFALEAGIQLRLRHTWLTRNEHRGAELLQVNPRHQVPALRHGSFNLSEATAIIRYLAENHGAECEKEWLGRTIRERAEVNLRLSWHHSNVRRKVTLDYFLPVLLAPAYRGTPRPEPATREKLRRAFRECLDQLEGLLGGRSFVALDRMTVADVLIAVDLYALDADPERDGAFLHVPAVSAWLERLRKRRAHVDSHHLWNAVAVAMRKRLLHPVSGPADPGWIAALCEARMAQRPEDVDE
jgi:glutathione S-transferase